MKIMQMDGTSGNSIYTGGGGGGGARSAGQ